MGERITPTTDSDSTSSLPDITALQSTRGVSGGQLADGGDYSFPSSCDLEDMEVAHVFGEDGDQSITKLSDENVVSISPYKATTVMTNIQRGNVQTQTPQYLTEQRARDLYQLAGQGEVNMIKTVVVADPKAAVLPDKNGLTLLHWAASYGQVMCVQYLLSLTILPTRASVDEALLLAAAGGHASVCSVLLDVGADVNTTSESRCTPVMYAVCGDHGRTVSVLLQRGASLAAKLDGKTVFDMARGNNATYALQAIEGRVLELLAGPSDNT